MIFDDPAVPRRFFSAGDNQIAGVGDGFERNLPAWIETVQKLYPDFPVYGSIIECSECLTRLIGQENALFWMGMYPDELGEQINRSGQFYLDSMKAQIRAAKGGGFIFQSDHSVSSDVSGETYDYIVKLVREYGEYPLELRECNLGI